MYTGQNYKILFRKGTIRLAEYSSMSCEALLVVVEQSDSLLSRDSIISMATMLKGSR